MEGLRRVICENSIKIAQVLRRVQSLFERIFKYDRSRVHAVQILNLSIFHMITHDQLLYEQDNYTRARLNLQ